MRRTARWLRPKRRASLSPNSCARGRYRSENHTCRDADRPALLQRIRLTPLADPKDALRLFVLLAPRLATAAPAIWVGGRVQWHADASRRAG